MTEHDTFVTRDGGIWEVSPSGPCPDEAVSMTERLAAVLAYVAQRQEQEQELGPRE